MFISKQPSVNHACVILPVHNRKVITLKCLAHLKEQGNLAVYRIIVIDDGSTDGTAQAILQQYPEATLLKGDGNLWWTGAIKLGMEYALSQGADYCVWLNDDTLPEPGAIQSLIDYCNSHSKTIAAANILDPQTREPSYGGVIRQNLRILPVLSKKQQMALCDGLNGNLVCLPTTLISTIGYPNNTLYPHYHGDTIYTHAAKRAGYKLVILHDVIAYCKNDHAPIAWLRSNQPFLQIVKDRLSVKSPHYWKAHLAYYRSFLGVFGALIYIYEIWLKMFILVIVRKIVNLFPLALKRC